MPNRNIHEIMGHIGREPELKYTASGDPVCFITIATSNDYKQGSEWIKRDPEWHNVVFFGELAELVVKEFRKGDAIMVRGKHKTRTEEWKGQVRYIGEITATEVYRPIYPKKAKEDETAYKGQAEAPF